MEEDNSGKKLKIFLSFNTALIRKKTAVTFSEKKIL